MGDLTNMKIDQSAAMNAELLLEAQRIGAKLSRFRIARGVKQEEAALRSGLSRNTVYRMEKGDPGVAFGQMLRYIDAVAPGVSIQDVLADKDPALLALSVRERSQRVRELSQKELKELDF